MSNDFVDENNSKRHASPDDVYSKTIKKIKEDGVCPFCSDQLKKYHKNPIIFENDYWLATKNMYPYEGAKVHILIIHKEHISLIKNINNEGWSNLQNIILKIQEKFSLKGGSFFIRFGDTKMTGASVSHLHAQLVSPEEEEENKKPIIVRLG
ncbi:MAG: HIT domain-containing protein [Candidatus Paceibacterota bacterium]